MIKVLHNCALLVYLILPLCIFILLGQAQQFSAQKLCCVSIPPGESAVIDYTSPCAKIVM